MQMGKEEFKKKSIIGMIEHLRGLIEINNMIESLYKE